MASLPAGHVTMTIPPTVARRYLLGRQGLWPARRWTGKEGAAQAIHIIESVQMDPVTIVARSHDLTLWSRVEGYQPDHLDELIHQDRRFFDYGGHLDIYPIEELPHWQLHMRRRLADERQVTFAAEHGELLNEVRSTVEAKGPLGNRDLKGNAQASSYRGRKDTSLALYHLWLTGELMTHSRRNFERLYDLRERVAPPEHDYESDEAQAEHYFAAKALRKIGLGTARAWTGAFTYMLHRKVDKKETAQWLDAMTTDGIAVAVLVDGQTEPYFLPAADLSLLDELANDQIPEAWQPLGNRSDQEVNFLSPLDNLLDRSRTQALFDFEHLWEIYKPAERRRWGRYTMPVLYGDQLVARIDPSLDRKTKTLTIDGLWLEDEMLASDLDFTEALARGLSRFARFHNADQVGISSIKPASFRNRLQASVSLRS